MVLTCDPSRQALDLADRFSQRYGISSILPLAKTCRKLQDGNEITVAVLGRFKAGKSSFLNHLLGRNLLPVGVIPVTAVVTEIAYGPLESAEVHHLDGRVQSVPLDSIRAFIAENENPENRKQVDHLTLDLPELHRFAGLRLVDTPGLESALAHNTEAAKDWLPNAGLAIVAMSVDPPLSEQDIALIETLYQYTPNVSLLVTKTDILAEGELAEVLAFIRRQLSRRFEKMPQILPYSIRPGHDEFKADVDRTLQDTLASFSEERTAILARKTDTLLRECEDYLRLALRAAETQDSERRQLELLAAAERAAIADAKSELHLMIQHAASGVRSRIAAALDEFQPVIEKALSIALEVEFPKWTASLAVALDFYQEWLRQQLSRRIGAVSADLRREFVKPLRKTSTRTQYSLQVFRDRLSERTERAFGIPLRTTEPDIAMQEPKAPDIRIGKIFDRNWELLSPLLPMWLIGKVLRRHFRRQLSFLVYANLSRVASQWEESIVAALAALEKDAGQRIDDLMKTVENLLSTDSSDAALVREDLVKIAHLRDPG